MVAAANVEGVLIRVQYTIAEGMQKAMESLLCR